MLESVSPGERRPIGRTGRHTAGFIVVASTITFHCFGRRHYLHSLHRYRLQRRRQVLGRARRLHIGKSAGPLLVSPEMCNLPSTMCEELQRIDISSLVEGGTVDPL